MLASQGDQLVALATLGDLETVLIGPLLDLAVAPALQKGVAERGLSRSGRLRGGGVLGSSRIGGDLAIAANAGNELVTAAGLRSWDTTLIEPSLQVRVGPGLVEPVAGIADGLADFVGDGLVVGAGGVQERVAGAWGWVGDMVVVEERLKLRLSPAGSRKSVGDGERTYNETL